jgi:hypothetical protein
VDSRKWTIYGIELNNWDPAYFVQQSLTYENIYIVSEMFGDFSQRLETNQ